MLITIDPRKPHVKIASCANPRNPESHFGQRCEPAAGFSSLDIEDSQEWISRLSWNVTRLDGAKCENVVQRKLIFPGLLTWEGYRRYVVAGTDTPEYFTMARGFFPPSGTQLNVIPAEFVDRSKGRAAFLGTVTYGAAVDLALEGDDKVVMTVGKWGLAESCEIFGQSVRFASPKWVLQVEAQFEIPKYDPDKKLTQTLWIAREIIRHCKKNFNILPKHLIVDRTGNGGGIHDVLVQEFGPEVIGSNFGKKATEMKVLEDDKETAEEQYDGLVTELFFATRKFMEADSLKIAHSVRLDRLQKELQSREFRQGSQGRSRVESKKEYKSRGNDSPDYADSLTLLIHLVRVRREFKASLVGKISSASGKPFQPSVVDKLDFEDMNEKD
jgi:hypothetical protein